MRLPLIGGAYSTRSIIASAQKCINLFPELNPRDALTPTTHYQRPGLRPLVSPTTPGPGRCIYRASNGQGYCVIGSTVYAINVSGSNLSLQALGNITTGLTNPVSMADNGVTVVVVDNSNQGWAITLNGNAFQTISDSTGTFQGALKADIIDTFLVFGPSPPNSNSNAFISTTSNQVQFNGLFVGGKTGYPDPLQTLFVNRHEVLLFGQLKSEIWYDAGNNQLPFAELPGAYIEHGTVAPYSVASSDISTFWLGQDLQGIGPVFRQRGYATTRISNHALEYQIRKMAKQSTIADAVAYTYTQDGHYFYVLNFPTADQTWVMDDSIQDPMLAWHQRGWTDFNGVLHRERLMGQAFISGVNCGIDWQNGTIYAIDPDYYVDTVSGQDYPIEYVRTFPHIGAGIDEQGQMVHADGKMMIFDHFIADIECGTIVGDPNFPPNITMRFSDDRGRTFVTGQLQSLGLEGQYLNWPTWRQTGRARDRIFELRWNGNGQTALNGAWVVGKVLHV